VKQQTLSRCLGCALTVLALGGCYAREGDPPAAAEPDVGAPVQFTFGTISGGELSSDTTRGRTTALLFVTTYDLPSQAEAQLLRDVVAAHKPLANAAIVMMEAPHSAPLAQVWADAIGLKLPIAMASPTLTAGAGDNQLGRIAGVPTLVVLDRQGRLIVKNEGALNREQIDDCLTRADGH
jgi:hypothetical protein